MINNFKKTIHNISSKNKELNWGREIIAKWSSDYINNLSEKEVRILDIGCAGGADLLNIKKSINNKHLNMYGVENHEPYEKEAVANNIKVSSIDIERNSLPYEDGFFDIVIINQVLEHTKEIFWICSEISRVLKKGGIVIVGVPNIAAFHNRFLVLFGQHPTVIETLSAHVRGYSIPAFKRFIERDDYFKVEKIAGSNLYPFPSFISKPITKLFPSLAVCIFFKIKRTDTEGEFIKILDRLILETPYYRGE